MGLSCLCPNRAMNFNANLHITWGLMTSNALMRLTVQRTQHCGQIIKSTVIKT